VRCRPRPEADSGSFIVDAHGTVLGFDQGMELLTGWPAAEVVGHHKKLEIPVADAEHRRFLAVKLFEGQLSAPESRTTRQLRFHAKDGSSVLCEVLVDRLAGHGERLLVRVVGVLARSRGSTEAADDLRGGLDDLTGLVDRNGFVDRLAQELRSARALARPLSLIVADVDHLRRINDRFGCEAGDEVLHRLAEILRASFGEETRLGRLGPDEFGTLLPGSGRGEARQLAASLRSTVERFPFFDRRAVSDGPAVTLSIGVASSPADAERPRDLMDRADEALGEARALGRNRVWCYTRRLRVPVEVPVYFDALESLLVGYSRDLSPSGIFVQTAEPIDIGMRCALTFQLPGTHGRVHVIGRVVRAVPPAVGELDEGIRIPGMGVEFERFDDPADRRAIEAYLHPKA
jgi:uncharacterized protein (TIGR02266 family)